MRSVLLSLCVVSLFFSACSDDDKKTTGGAGAAGEAGEAGEAGAAGESAGACPSSGTGNIKLIVTGLPSGVDASVAVDQPLAGSEGQTLTQSATLTGVAAGPWGVLAKRAYDADAIVRTVYEPHVSLATFCLDDGGSQTITVSYTKIPTSNQLWTITSGDSGPLLGFASSTLSESGAPAASTAVGAAVATALAFDHDGNLWAAGNPDAQATVVRYGAGMLDGAGMPERDFAFDVPAIVCVPAIKSAALDASGNLWLSACDNQVLRIDKPALDSESADVVDVTPGVTLTGFDLQNEDLAFDSAGNLWVATKTQVLRFDKARLGADDAAAPNLILTVTTDDAEPRALSANFLTFDVGGNLWATDFDGNQVFEIRKADLRGTGERTAVAPVHVSVDILAVMSRPAFDDGGSLWLSLAAGKFGKLSPEQLAVSSDAGAPTTPLVTISSADAGSLDGFAFFPAASGLPLASAQP